MNDHRLREWEESIFRSAAFFNVVSYKGPGTYDSKNYKSYARALNAVRNAKPDRHGRTPLIYAVGPKQGATERSFCIGEKEYNHYLAIWKAMRR